MNGRHFQRNQIYKMLLIAIIKKMVYEDYPAGLDRPESGTLQRKCHLCIPFLGIAWLSPNFQIHVSVSDLYFPGSIHIFSCSRIGRSIVGIYKSLTDTECGNWDCNRTIPFLGIFVSSFQYCFFAVRHDKRS